MRVLVTGGRHFDDADMMLAVIDHIDCDVGEITEIIHGDAKGADKMAGEVAKAMKVPVRAFPADWDRLRAMAGPVRNSQMLAEGRPDLVLAFPGNSGTRDMVNKARNVGVRVIRAVEAYRWIQAHKGEGARELPDLTSFGLD